MHLYEYALLVPAEDIEFPVSQLAEMPWTEFWLNPRMLRGSDFLMRWSQGVWSEKRLIEAVNASAQLFALPYGPSGVAPEDPKGVELYFERLEAAGKVGQKRPDLLVFRKQDRAAVMRLVVAIGGEEELPFTNDSDHRVQSLLNMAVLAVECENSLWRAAKMPSFGKEMSERRLAEGRTGFPKSAVLPTIIVKDEDVGRLNAWQADHRVPIHIWHVFFDRAYGISFDDARELFKAGKIVETIQTFQAPGGATTKKGIYKIYYHYAYELGAATEQPTLKAQIIEDKNGHVLPYVTFEGGRLQLSNTAIEIVSRLNKRDGHR